MSNAEITEIVKQTIAELGGGRALKRIATKNAYQKTESVLYDYPKYLAAVESKKERIKEIQENGIPQKSSSITSYLKSGGTKVDRDIDDVCAEIEETISRTEKLLTFIDIALLDVQHDEYAQIIPLYYFERNTLEEIGFKLEKDTATISRNKSRLINQIKVVLFTDEVLKEIMLL